MGLVLTCDLLSVVLTWWITPARLAEIATFGALVLCAVICVEAMRRLGPPTRLARDLLGAWWLPAILLLPPLYSLLIPVPLFLLLQLRIRRRAVHRRIFEAASIALSGFVSSWVFHGLLAGDAARAVEGPVMVADGTLVAAPGLFYALSCCALFTLLKTAIVAIAVRLSSPETPWRRLLWDRETLVLDSVELCVGLTVAILAGLSVALLLIALPPVVLLQRSLLFQQLQTAARTDSKTGLLNAATWEQEAGVQLARALQARRSVAVLIIDIDHFKQVNDTYGHVFGDQVLLGVANTLTHHLRQSDVLGRFGGEEFVVLLPGADMAEACRVAERLRSRVGRMRLMAGENSVTITISIGVALLRVHGDDVIELVGSADLALYRAKGAGRNRVCLPFTGPWAIPGGTRGGRVASGREG